MLLDKLDLVYHSRLRNRSNSNWGMVMVLIYGRAESEMEILDKFHDSINSLEEVDTFHDKLKGKLSADKKEFYDKVPDKIKEEEAELL